MYRIGNMIKKKLYNLYDRTSEKLLLLFPDWITGKSEIMMQKYYRRYGDRDYRLMIQKNKVQTMGLYIGILAIFMLFSIFSTINQFINTEEITSIHRPEQGETSKEIPIEARMKYRDYELDKKITVRVKPKELSKNEKRKLLHDYKSSILPTLILGDNRDINHVSKPLYLPERDSDSGITIRWISDRPDLISEDGEVNLINEDSTEKIALRAELALDELTAAAIFIAGLDPDAAAEDYARNMAGRLENMIEKLSADQNQPVMELPDELGNGIEVRWFSGIDKGRSILVPFLIIAILIVFFKRYDLINKEIKAAEESIMKDLPEFINKLVLLLNAGLVVSTAFSKIVEDYEAFQKKGKRSEQREKRLLYEELSEIQKRVSQSNASLIRELQSFSQRCGVREMVRLTAVITDNWNKGSMLAEKLEGESTLLWINRKKRAEEKGKLAETKLTFPLMILLIVLIMVTIAPALLEM